MTAAKPDHDESPANDGAIHGYHGNAGCAKQEADWMIELLPQGGIFIEVGTYHGVTVAYLADNRLDSLFISIDPFPGWEGIDRLRNCAGSLEYWERNRRKNTRLLVGTLQDAEILFKPGIADIVFVDGNHLYDPVLADLRISQILVKPGGKILVHDYGRKHQEDIERAVEVFMAESGWKYKRKVWTTALLEHD